MSERAGGAIVGATSLVEHEERALILGELHARPFLPLKMPRRIYQFAFMTGDDEARADRASIAELARSRGVPPPAADAKFHRFDFGPWHLRWEQHTEFTTYTWSTELDAEQPFKHASPLKSHEIDFRPPGRLIAAVHMSVLAREALIEPLHELFHPQSQCVVEAAQGMARLSTDFQADTHGFTRFLIESRGMSPHRAGRLAQRVLEIETYRTLALLGLPVARRASPELSRMERELSHITQEIGSAKDAVASQALLKRLSDLAAAIEAQGAKTAFRFGATRAYYGLVKSRLDLIQEKPFGDHVSISAFFRGRLEPAIETCNAVETRQERISGQIARAADLLRTGIQFELEEQNRDLLASMDRRAHLQLRLQQTVEGLSVAAISYYVVGLITYIAKGVKDAGLLPKVLTPEMVTAGSVPLVLLGVWALMRRVRHKIENGAAGGH